MDIRIVVLLSSHTCKPKGFGCFFYVTDKCNNPQFSLPLSLCRPCGGGGRGDGWTLGRQQCAELSQVCGISLGTEVWERERRRTRDRELGWGPTPGISKLYPATFLFNSTQVKMVTSGCSSAGVHQQRGTEIVIVGGESVEEVCNIDLLLPLHHAL